MPLRRKNRSTEVYKLQDHEVLLTLRTRLTPTDLVLTPGTVLLPATSRGRYRLVDAQAIAVGATVAGATSIDITGYVNGVKVILVTMPVAGLTRSTMLRMGTAGSTILADGVSNGLLDVGTAVSVERVGGAVTGATGLDIFLYYALETASMLSGQ